MNDMAFGFEFIRPDANSLQHRSGSIAYGDGACTKRFQWTTGNGSGGQG